MDGDIFWSVVEVSSETDVFTSFSIVDENLSLNSSVVVMMTLISFIDVDVTAWVFGAWFDDISNEVSVEVITEVVNDAVINSLFSVVFDESPVVCVVIELVLVSEFLLLIIVDVSY